MNKETIFSVVRTLLSAFGSFLIGKNIAGTTVDMVVWEMWVGGFMGAASLAWSIFDKTATIEMFQSGIRNFLILIGGFLVGWGKLAQGTWDAIMGIIVILLPFIYSQLSKQKSIDIATGKLGLRDLSGVKEMEAPVNPVAHTPETKPSNN